MANKAVLLNTVPPYGYVVANGKWKGSALAQSLQGNVKVMFEEHLGVVDFLLSDKSCVLHVSESDMVAGSAYKRKIVRFRNANSGLHGLVVVEKTRLSEQDFPSLQKFVVFELGLTLLPVGSAAEAAQLLVQLALGVSKENPFRRSGVSGLLDPVVLALVQQIPGVGKVKAAGLLRRFSSVHQLCGAPVRELEPIVGHAAAQHVWGFFHNPFD
ncbi:Fanconi anemia core complex-associated protein 24 [Denticeps clupeoides]|uniref:Fanconi anemia core complex-associated protein 24 pseudonuclease domain-containing protein n=1 Tax=Denticeps clupeoides TaxID=299321 RepID=A0AAY4D3L7_9TELE|nr:Fanconi anemia core complex-associated protein 24 [Denticeps clupeoides]XP_028813733.1 Fanconi anemia core complex-associated protein 24 [Denticeps clupeoides]